MNDVLVVPDPMVFLVPPVQQDRMPPRVKMIVLLVLQACTPLPLRVFVILVYRVVKAMGRVMDVRIVVLEITLEVGKTVVLVPQAQCLLSMGLSHVKIVLVDMDHPPLEIVVCHVELASSRLRPLPVLLVHPLNMPQKDHVNVSHVLEVLNRMLHKKLVNYVLQEPIPLMELHVDCVLSVVSVWKGLHHVNHVVVGHPLGMD